MEIDWKSLSISLIISVIVNGVIGIYLLYDYFNRLSSVFEFLVSEYIKVTSGNNSSYDALTIAGGSPNQFEFWIIVFMVSFVLITTVSYFILHNYNKRKK
jgi:hypothetical protein